MFKCLFLSVLLFWLPGIAAVAQPGNLAENAAIKPRIRVMVDNDFGGDPDGLFQLVHQVLSPSVEIRGIIGSHLKPGDFFDTSNQTATNACKMVRQLLGKMNLENAFPIFEGSNLGLADIKTPRISEASKAIVKEAMRDDTKLPLYVVCGAGLTDVASAYLAEPAIAKRMTVIWIGGPEYPQLALPPPGYTPLEYNLGIDIRAGQVVFNSSDIRLWQVPRSTYRQALLSFAELELKIKTQGPVGEFLANKIEQIMTRTQKFNLLLGETYILGDSPLVLLTSLQSSFEADPSSSRYSLVPAPAIDDAGLYKFNSNARNIRVYTDLDLRLMFEDFFLKLGMFNGRR